MRKIIISATLVLALAACNKDKSATITTADGKEVKISMPDSSNEGGTIKMQSADGSGSFTYGANAAKQTLPLGLPVYPGAQVSTAMTGSQDGKTGGMFTIESKDATAEQITLFYKAQAEKLGMTTENGDVTPLSGANMAGFRAKGADGKSMVLSARPGGPNGETHAMIIIGND